MCFASGFEESGDQFVKHSWLRLPIGAVLTAITGPEGAMVWVKEGHLRNPPPLPAAGRD